MRVALVGCGRQKQVIPAPAAELYTSRHFKTSLEWANRFCDRTLILSSKYGLIEPSRVIAPYNVTLSKAPAASAPDKHGVRPAHGVEGAWHRIVARQLRQAVPPGTTLVFTAGRAYYGSLVPYLEGAGFLYEYPFAHCKLAQRTVRMRAQLNGLPRPIRFFER
jgi:hypothetical protein